MILSDKMSDNKSEHDMTNGNATAENEAVESVLNEAAGSAGATEDMNTAAQRSPNGAVNRETGDGEKGDDAIVSQLRAELATEQNRYEELNDRFQRTSAEFQNTLRRREKQMNETVERASQHVVTKLLPVLDDFERAFQNLPEGARTEQASWLEGFQQIQRKLQQVLDDEGVTAIPAEGIFDPTLHEAITNEPSDSVESGHIIATLRIGYEQRGRVIRPALVRVAA